MSLSSDYYSRTLYFREPIRFQVGELARVLRQIGETHFGIGHDVDVAIDVRNTFSDGSERHARGGWELLEHLCELTAKGPLTFGIRWRRKKGDEMLSLQAPGLHSRFAIAVFADTAERLNAAASDLATRLAAHEATSPQPVADEGSVSAAPNTSRAAAATPDASRRSWIREHPAIAVAIVTVIGSVTVALINRWPIAPAIGSQPQTQSAANTVSTVPLGAAASTFDSLPGDEQIAGAAVLGAPVGRTLRGFRPIDALRLVDSTPPLQRDSVVRTLLGGRYVDWTGYVYSLTSLKGGASISLARAPGRTPYVIVLLSADRVAEARELKAQQRVSVFARIDSLEKNGWILWLSDAHLK